MPRDASKPKKRKLYGNKYMNAAKKAPVLESNTDAGQSTSTEAARRIKPVRFSW